MNDHINPNHKIDGELLSAYLDDELTASERVEVEQALKNSPPSRESLQELKILRNEMQWLAVEFHPNERQMMDAVINKIRDRNLSVHGQATYSNVKSPIMTKDWKRRLPIPALLTLTAGVLAVLTLQFIPNKQSMTLVQTERIDATPPGASFYPAENSAHELESNIDNRPPLEGEGASRGGGHTAFANELHVQENIDSRDKANSLAAGLSATADDPAAPAQSRARSFPEASAMADSADEQQLRQQAADKTDVADVTYHLQVKQKDLPTLLALLTNHQNIAQNTRQEKGPGFAEGKKNIVAESKRRVAPSKAIINRVQESTVNQIVMFRSNASQLAMLVDALQKNPEFALSMNHLQRSTLGNQLMDKNNDLPSADVKSPSTTTILSDTIFSIQVIPTP